MKNALFIINPVSGTKKKDILLELIPKVLEHAQVDYQIQYTEYAGHARELARQARAKGFDCVVAVGGDGSVNEVGTSLAGSMVTMGIIPLGSGNGLARSLDLAMQPENALLQLVEGKTVEIDTLKLNQHEFVNVAGIGFDASVAHNFAMQSHRGLPFYIKAMFETYKGFEPLDLRFEIEGQWHEEKSFVMSFANAGQYGNNAYIAPMADFSDGLMDVALLTPFPKALAPMVGLSLVTKGIHNSRYYRYYKTKKIRIETHSSLKVHVDGEAVHTHLPLTVSVTGKKLKVICG